MKVVATTTQVADFVREVGGEAVEVEQILQPNSDPHDYEPRPSDVEAVADAELVFVSGRGLDDWAEELVSDSGGDAQIVNLGAMGPIRLAGEERHEHEEDEHSDEVPNEDEHAGEVARA